MNLSLAFLLLAGAFGAAQARPGTLKGRTLQGDAKRKLKANHKLRGGAALKGSESTRRLQGEGCPSSLDFYDNAREGFIRAWVAPDSHVSSLGTGRLIGVEGGALDEVSYTGVQLESHDVPQDVYLCASLCLSPPLVFVPIEQPRDDPFGGADDPFGADLEPAKSGVGDGVGYEIEEPPLTVGFSWDPDSSVQGGLCTCYYENSENPVDASPTLSTNEEVGDLELGCTYCFNCLEGDACPDFYEGADAFRGIINEVLPSSSIVSTLGAGRLVDVDGHNLDETSYTGVELMAIGETYKLEIPEDASGCSYVCLNPPPPSKEAEPCFGKDGAEIKCPSPTRHLEYEEPPLPVGFSWKAGEGKDPTNLCTCYYENPENPVAASPTVRTDGEGDLDVGCTYCLNCNTCEAYLPFLTQDLYDKLTGTEGRDAAYANVNDFCMALNRWNDVIYAKAYEREDVDDFIQYFVLFATEDEDRKRAILAAFFGNAAATSGEFANTRDPDMCPSPTLIGGEKGFVKSGEAWYPEDLEEGTYGCRPEGWEWQELYESGGFNLHPSPLTPDDKNCPFDVDGGCKCSAQVAPTVLGVDGTVQEAKEYDYLYPYPLVEGEMVTKVGEAYLIANELFFSRGPLGLAGKVAYYEFYDFFNNEGCYFCGHPDDVADVEENLWLSAFYLWTTGSVNKDGALSFGTSVATFSDDEDECATDVDRLNFYCKAAGVLEVEELLSMEGCEGLQDAFDACACDGTCSSCSPFVQVQCPTSSPTMSPNLLVVEVGVSLNGIDCSNDRLASDASSYDDLHDGFREVFEAYAASSYDDAAAEADPGDLDAEDSESRSLQLIVPDNRLTIARSGVAVGAMRICGQTNGSRRLQTAPTDSWDVVAEIISVVVCSSEGCTNPQDLAAIEATVNSISDTFQDAIASGDFATALSQNTNIQSALDSTILACLVAWGTVYGDTATFGSGAPLPTANSNTTNLYYPDWTGNSGTCINDGDQPLYMKLNEDAWLYDTLEGCCARYFSGWNLAKCMNTQGTGLWYVSYKDERCVTDCEEGTGGATCGGIAAPISTELYSDPRACCEAKMQWINLDFCENESLQNECYGGTGKWYRGSNSELCVRDCDPNTSDTCGGVVEEYWVRLHDSPEECCAAEHSWIDEDLCAARSTGTPTDMFWPDKQEGKCVNDTETPVKDLSTSLYESAEDCCAEINWVSVETCVSDATGVPISTVPGSEKWFFYSRGSEQKCAKLCEGAAPCGGVDPDGVGVNDYFDNLETCCDRLSWVARDECELE